MTIETREKTLHRLFLISVWLKGAAGLLETLAGVPFFFVTPRAIEDFVVLLTAPELSEDPNDWIATTIRSAVHHFSADTALFAWATSDCKFLQSEHENITSISASQKIAELKFNLDHDAVRAARDRHLQII